MSVNIVNVEKVEILPSNQPNNNTYSFRGGNPIISLQIPAQAKYLRASSLRINGTFKISGQNVNGGAVQTPDNNNLKAGGTSSIKLSSRVGVNSCFQNVVLVSASSNQSLESIRNYGRLVTSLLSSTHSGQDLATEKSATAVLNGLNSSSSVMCNNATRFSVPLYAGMLMGSGLIPLSAIGGLQINLELCSDNQLLSGTHAGTGNGAFYELSDVSLTCDLAVADAEGTQALAQGGSGALSYNSWSSLYSVINSSDATQTYNLANSQVLSVLHNFIPVSHTNNYGQDGFSTGMLKNQNGGNYNVDVDLKRVSFSRGGVRLGLDYEMDCSVQSAAKIPETQVMLNYLSAFQTIGRMLNSRQLLGYGGNALRADRPDNKENNRLEGKSADAERNFGIGLALDPISDVGVNFKGMSYATRIVSTLDGNSPNAVHTHLLSKNTLNYSPNGIFIQS